jgi:SsrA-binding protein
MMLIQNKKARLNFDIDEEFEAGLNLTGFEVRSLRGHRGTLEGAHITVRGGEAYVLGIHIPPYQALNTPIGYDPERHRRLLLTKKQIAHLTGVEKQKGLTIVPLSLYSKGRFLKLSIGVARGKKRHDKRETLKKRDAVREIDRTLKSLKTRE